MCVCVYVCVCMCSYVCVYVSIYYKHPSSGCPSRSGFFAITDNRCGFDWAISPGVLPDGTPDQTARGYPFNYFTQGVAAAEVEIDLLTGDSAIRRYATYYVYIYPYIHIYTHIYLHI